MRCFRPLESAELTLVSKRFASYLAPDSRLSALDLDPGEVG
jgi:hypothetical protein